ncbi:DUF72 domain-containing protein [Bacillus sp. FJAT-42376]|uniref:DUF72 domain-containing protein n=1 Tax=Bacillus sp. FJAT-42376 TaxID=2014076 RepID=UPI000F4F78B7|nr:DUF72 domain-containing protein [Bacillus sp. FJAT-42376]AZB44299.1 DUF72 domain-containing protein [Bacillus sp. FJAT-42376]
MIQIGLTGWGDHDSLYPDSVRTGDKLKEYSAYFPVVELDASFYAVQPERNMKKWADETPGNFQFIVKAYQGMTGHERGEIPFETKSEMFEAFKLSLSPLIEEGKMAMVLFQFPPWFDCKKENVDYLRWCRQQMEEIPCALEFRNQTWFEPAVRDKTLLFMREENWIHSVCDEPQAGMSSIPAVLEIANPQKTLVRFHGRNVHGWNKTGSDQEWREVRYLYKYSTAELEEWGKALKDLSSKTKELFVVFNNNSGGDAAGNALELIELLGVTYKNLAPRQMSLLDFE